jgi:hypothetical protein
MAEFSGMFALTQNNVDAFTMSQAGVYVLDRSQSDPFAVYYVGRSDDDLKGRLKQWVGTRYVYFKYLHTGTTKAAYELECAVYHKLKPPDNIIHPAVPSGTLYSCPERGCAGW